MNYKETGDSARTERRRQRDCMEMNLHLLYTDRDGASRRMGIKTFRPPEQAQQHVNELKAVITMGAQAAGWDLLTIQLEVLSEGMWRADSRNLEEHSAVVIPFPDAG